jgi:hypothetical protein
MAAIISSVRSSWAIVAVADDPFLNTASSNWILPGSA